MKVYIKTTNRQLIKFMFITQIYIIYKSKVKSGMRGSQLSKADSVYKGGQKAKPNSETGLVIFASRSVNFYTINILFQK